MGIDGDIFHPIYFLNVYRIKLMQVLFVKGKIKIIKFISYLREDSRFNIKSDVSYIQIKELMDKHIDNLTKQNLIHKKNGIIELTKSGIKFCKSNNIDNLISISLNISKSASELYKKKNFFDEIDCKKTEIKMKKIKSKSIDLGTIVVPDKFEYVDVIEPITLEEFEENITDVFDNSYETDFNFGTCNCGFIIKEGLDGNYPVFCPKCENTLTKNTFKKFKR